MVSNVDIKIIGPMDRSRQDACTVSHVTHARDRKLQRTKTVSVLEDPIAGVEEAWTKEL